MANDVPRSLIGLHIGVKIHVTGAGKHNEGIISREPQEGDTHIQYRSTYNKGERLAPLDKIRKINGPNKRTTTARGH